VEAGLRTADRYSPFPEEMNRRLTSAIATFHFAPTTVARARLLAEHIESETVVVTGNTVIDALRHLRPAMRQPAGITLQSAVPPHPADVPPPREPWREARRDLRRDPGHRGSASRRYRRVPCSPAPGRRMQEMREELDGIRGIQLLEPVDYPELLWLLEASTIVLTDSGGLQEEGAAFKRPCWFCAT
jgi:UDP-N-acetylglucosamine 2-epimerase (non-hydrolysing)